MNNMDTPEIEWLSNWNNSEDLRWGRQMHPNTASILDGYVVAESSESCAQYLRYLEIAHVLILFEGF